MLSRHLLLRELFACVHSALFCHSLSHFFHMLPYFPVACKPLLRLLVVFGLSMSSSIVMPHSSVAGLAFRPHGRFWQHGPDEVSGLARTRLMVFWILASRFHFFLNYPQTEKRIKIAAVLNVQQEIWSIALSTRSTFALIQTDICCHFDCIADISVFLR